MYPRASARYKRPFDLAVIVVAGLLFTPVWLLLCIAIPIAIRLEDGGPVFHVQTRLGRAGRHFRMFKFRTMIEEAERPETAVLASENDPRLTRVGRILRSSHLDEIPQILNVVMGDMSLVGPRPERPELANLIRRKLPDFDQRLRVRPGIAGLSQARRHYHVTARHKLRYDNLYIASMTPLLDLKLLVACFLVSIGLRRLRTRLGTRRASVTKDDRSVENRRESVRRRFPRGSRQGDSTP